MQKRSCDYSRTHTILVVSIIVIVILVGSLLIRSDSKFTLATPGDVKINAMASIFDHESETINII